MHTHDLHLIPPCTTHHAGYSEQPRRRRSRQARAQGGLGRPKGPRSSLGVSGGAHAAAPHNSTREHRGSTHSAGLWGLQHLGGAGLGFSPQVGGLRWELGQAGGYPNV